MREAGRSFSATGRPKSSVCRQKLLALALFVFARTASAQAPVRPKKADLPAENEIRFQAVTQDSNGPWRYLRRGAKIETSDMLITADEIDYNSDTNWAYAKGHVELQHFVSGDFPID